MLKVTVILFTVAVTFIFGQPFINNECFSDTFGYYYLDSDTTAPGAPVFNWISIYNRGTRITGLADDNVKGPAPTGFNFPFYWKQVNSFYIGSNGYISYGDNFLSAPPFQSLPSIKRPNNIIAPLMADLDFTTGTPSCWYWTNAADTFIVEFDSIQFWSTGGLATFQIILCRSDLSITFQYQTVQGTPFGGWSSTNSNTVGIENSIGTIGVQYLHDGAPTQNQLHDSLAIKFFRPCSSNLEIHDVRPLYSLNKQSGAVFVLPGNTRTVWTKVENTGNCYEDWYPIYAKITDSSGSQVYADSQDIICRIPGFIDSIMFLNSWIPATTGRYCLNVQTALTSDMCRTNDTMQVEVNVVNNYNDLAYDNGPNVFFNWNRSAGFANQFVPPQYPWYIRGAKIYASAPSPSDITIKLLDDNGPDNSPGDVLAQTIVTVTSPNWYFVAFPDPVTVIYNGSFFIGATSQVANQLSFGMDTTTPFSHRLWEYTGTWNLSRYSLSRDVCIRSMVFTGVDELPTKNLVSSLFSIIPNPFRQNAVIHFQNPFRQNKIVRIFNTTGVRVRTIATKEEYAIWDGRNDAGVHLPNGCYFVRFADEPVKSISKVIIAR